MRERLAAFLRDPWLNLVTAVLVAGSGVYDLTVTLPGKVAAGHGQDLAGEGLVALWGFLLILSAVKDVLGGFLRLDHALEKLEDEGPVLRFLRGVDRLEQGVWWNLGLGLLYMVCGVFELVESMRDLELGLEVWFVGLLLMGSWIVLRSLAELAHVLEFMKKAGVARPHPRLEALAAWLERPAVGTALCCAVMAVGLADVVLLEKVGHSQSAQYGMVLAVFMKLVKGGKVLGHAGNVLGSSRR